MSPTIAYAPDGGVRVAVGAAGGPTIIAQVAKVLMGVIDWNLTPEQAVALPNMYIYGDTLAVEQGTFLAGLVPQIQARGAKIEAGDLGSKLNAIGRVGGSWSGAADPRSEGVALPQ